MQWIDKFTKGTYGVFAGQVIEGFQPLDFYHFLPMWYDLWIKKIARVIKILDLENKTFSEIKELLPPPSNMRAILVKIIPTYRGYPEKNKDECRLVANFFARMLMEACPKDPFAEISNPCHNDYELAQTINKVRWENSDVQKAKNIGRLITSAGSLVHGIYNDVVTDFGWDAFGPYNVSLNDEGYSFLIRHFTNLAPRELWIDKFLSSKKEILIYTLYQGVEWEISGVGCHTICKSGSPVQGMKKFAIIADGEYLSDQNIADLIGELSIRAEELYKQIHKMNFEELKLKVMEQECYQLKKIFDMAGIDWQPDEEMITRIANKELLTGLIPHGKMMTSIKEYESAFGIKDFEKNVLM